jgi:type IV pilus assembly protein PilC
MQTAAMKLPVFGNLIIYKEMMIFTKTFSSLLKNNVFITESMDILSKITSNEIYREIMANTINYIGRGEKISASFRDHWAVPDVAYYMMVTGESTGELAEMMGKVSDYYAEQHPMILNKNKISPPQS